MNKLQDILEEQDILTREMCKKSLYFFFQEFWGETCNEPLIKNWHIEYICQELEKASRRLFKFVNGDLSQEKKRESRLYDLLINISPGSTKSTIVSQVFPAWCWINDPTIRFQGGSYSGDLAVEQSTKTKDILMSTKFRTLFPEIRFKKDKEGKTLYQITYDTICPKTGRVISRLGGDRLSTSPGGMSTGLHAHIVIIDDPLKPKDAGGITSAALDSANSWIKETLSSRTVGADLTLYIMVMQRISENDPSGMWLQEAKKGQRKLKHICIPAELSEDLRPKELAKFYKNGLFDVNRFPKAVLKKKEGELGIYGYSGQMMQSPTPLSGGMFQTENFVVVENFDREQIDSSVRYWDKANTMGAGAFTVGCLMHKLKSGKFIVEDIVRGQWSADIREEIMRKTAEQDGKTTKVVVEQEPGSGGKESAQNTVSKLAGFVVEADRVTGDKALRADPYASQVNVGNVYLLKADWNRDFINEHKFFPNSKYKDQVDASSGAFNKMFIGKIAGGWRSKKE